MADALPKLKFSRKEEQAKQARKKDAHNYARAEIFIREFYRQNPPDPAKVCDTCNTRIFHRNECRSHHAQPALIRVNLAPGRLRRLQYVGQ